MATKKKEVEEVGVLNKIEVYIVTYNDHYITRREVVEAICESDDRLLLTVQIENIPIDTF